eukprot:TRINITY_DN14085_c0_g1_i1.p1 TRINITY_DN14085_c0_g1~~TRINITY_DN14085_c0_g1_i1.p1  ORF type:complete len:495 (+),score=85.27 TRINITY_DN14085_c0_g1_i1:37-1521(+)
MGDQVVYTKDSLGELDGLDDFLTVQPETPSKRAGGIFTSPPKRARVDEESSPSSAPSQAISFNTELAAAFKPSTSLRTTIELYPNCKVGYYRFMYESLFAKAEVLDERIRKIGEAIVKQYDLATPTRVGVPSQDTVVCIGRIACDAEAKINEQSVVLVGAEGDRIRLDLSDAPAFSVFPGQVVAVEGINLSGSQLLVKRFFSGSALRAARTPENELRAYQAKLEGQPMSLFIAAGPYTASDSVDYQPLRDLIAAIKRSKPDVAILMGPFVDGDNTTIKEGRVDISFEALFQKEVESLIVELKEHARGTQVVLIPSLKDVHHENVLPQPAFNLEPNDWLQPLSNPAMFSVNEVTIAATSHDIVSDILTNESSRGVSGNRFARLCEHLINQRSFYPLFPAVRGSNMDFSRAPQFDFLATPDILIVPSNFRHFILPVGNTLCINPGWVMKRQARGTYAMVSIHPLAVREAPEGQSEGRAPRAVHNILSRTRVDIMNV